MIFALHTHRMPWRSCSNCSAISHNCVAAATANLFICIWSSILIKERAYIRMDIRTSKYMMLLSIYEDTEDVSWLTFAPKLFLLCSLHYLRRWKSHQPIKESNLLLWMKKGYLHGWFFRDVGKSFRFAFLWFKYASHNSYLWFILHKVGVSCICIHKWFHDMYLHSHISVHTYCVCVVGYSHLA